MQHTYSLETYAALGQSPNDSGSVAVLDGGKVIIVASTYNG